MPPEPDGSGGGGLSECAEFSTGGVYMGCARGALQGVLVGMLVRGLGE